MAIYKVQAPDKRILRFEGPDNATQQQILGFAEKMYMDNLLAEQDDAKKEEPGLWDVAKGAAKRNLSSIQTAITAPFGAEEAATAGLERQKAIEEPVGFDWEKIKAAKEKEGWLSGIGEAIGQVPETIAEQAPNLAGMAAGAALGAPLGPVGAVLGGAAYPFLTQSGANIERQAAEQQAQGQPVDISLPAAYGAGVVQTGLESIGGPELALLRGMSGKALSKEAMEQVAKEGILKAGAKGVAKTVAEEVPTEIGQQALELAQAGRPLTDQQALEEYLAAGVGAGLAGPVGGPMRIASGMSARAELERKQAEEAGKQEPTDEVISQVGEDVTPQDLEVQDRLDGLEQGTKLDQPAQPLTQIEPEQEAEPVSEMVQQDEDIGTTAAAAEEPEAQPASELFKSFGIGPTAKIRKEFDNHDLTDPEQAAQVNEALRSFKTKNVDTQAKVDAHITQEPQNAQAGPQTEPAATVEPTGLTGSDADTMGSGGRGGVGYTATPEMAIEPTVEPSGVPTGDVNAGERAEQPTLAEKPIAADAEMPEEQDIQKLREQLASLNEGIKSGAYGRKGDIEYDALLRERSGVAQRIKQLESGQAVVTPNVQEPAANEETVDNLRKIRDDAAAKTKTIIKANKAKEESELAAHNRLYEEDPDYASSVDAGREAFDALEVLGEVPYSIPVGKEYGAPLQGAAKTAVDKGNLQGAINALANAHPDKQIGNLLHRVKNLVGGVQLQRGKASDTEAGQYDAATNTITLHPTYGDKEHVVMHEATHAALAKVLSNANHPITKEFNNFFNEVKNQLGNEYGGTDLQEFAAEFMGNAHFQELLKNIQTPKKQSMFGAIIDAIARMLGFKQNTSAYDTAVKHLNNVLDIAEGGQVAPIVQTAQGMGAAVSEGFDDLGEALKHMNKVPKNAKKAANDLISNVASGGVQKKLMDLISLNNMADMLSLRGDVSPAVREMSTIMSEGVKKLDNLLNQRASEQAKRTHASSDIMRKILKAFNSNNAMFDKMADMAIEASIEEVDVLSNTPPAKASKAAAYKKLRAQFLALEKSHPAIANSYRMMREKYKSDIEEYLDMIKDTLGESVANQVRNEYAARGLEGYIPFMRFGDFVLEFADPKTDERQVMQFESAKERGDFIDKNLKPIGAEYFTHKRLEDVSYNSRRAAPNTLLTKVMQELEAKGASKQQLDAIYQLQLSLMPSTSIAKRAMHRGNVAGMSRDLVRGFATVQNQWDRRLTASKYDAQLLAQIEAIKGAAARSPDTLIHAAAQSITDRTPFMLNPVHGNMTNMLSAFNYHMYIAGNLSSAFVNISSLPLMVWPKLGAQFGFDKASSAMNAVKGKALGDWGSDAKYRGLYAAMVDRNQLSSSMDRAILEGRNVATGDHTGIMRAVLNLSSIPFTESEKYNRAVTAMAAYDLAKAKGMKEADAVEYAVRTVEDMHTSGSAANGSKLFQSDLGRIFFTFKSFAWNSAYVAGRAWALAVRDVKNMKQDPNESAQDFAKRQADMKEAIAQSRRQLLGMYGMSFAFGGIKGLPFYGALSVLATAMHALAGDDDEPWDLEKELEDFAGKNIANGFVNELTNLQIGQRTSIVNDLLYRDNPRAVADLGYVGAGALALLGPAGGFLSNAENSYNMFRQGHIERAIEGVMPSSVRNIMKGMRYASEGAVTLKGDPVDSNISAYSSLMQVVGFAPADLSTIQERKSMAKAYEKGITDRRSSILAKYNMAIEAGDQEIIQETYVDIDKFNKAIPELAIRGETLQRSLAQRRSNQRKMLYGMTFNDKLRGRIQNEFFSDLDEEEED